MPDIVFIILIKLLSRQKAWIVNKFYSLEIPIKKK